MSKQLKGRPAEITFKTFDERTKKVEKVTAKARFHCWGIRKPKTEGRPAVPFPETVGICELESGEVKLVQPEKIVFLDAPRV